MNNVTLVGRLTKDPESKNTTSSIPYCNFTIAVDRPFKNQNGEREADFINCVAWRQTSDFICKFFNKGKKIGITGSIQTRNYEDESGTKRYITEVVVNTAEFVESQNASSAPATPAPAPKAAPKAAPAPDFPAADLPEAELPFEF